MYACMHVCMYISWRSCTFMYACMHACMYVSWWYHLRATKQWIGACIFSFSQTYTHLFAVMSCSHQAYFDPIVSLHCVCMSVHSCTENQYLCLHIQNSRNNVCMCVYVCMHACMYVCTYVKNCYIYNSHIMHHVCIYMNAYIYIYIYIFSYVCMHA
jgi:hypothetical protein